MNSNKIFSIFYTRGFIVTKNIKISSISRNCLNIWFERSSKINDMFKETFDVPKLNNIVQKSIVAGVSNGKTFFANGTFCNLYLKSPRTIRRRGTLKIIDNDVTGWGFE